RPAPRDRGLRRAVRDVPVRGLGAQPDLRLATAAVAVRSGDDQRVPGGGRDLRGAAQPALGAVHLVLRVTSAPPRDPGPRAGDPGPRAGSGYRPAAAVGGGWDYRLGGEGARREPPCLRPFPHGYA